MPEAPIQGPFHDGPFLEAAVICERVLVEQDGVKSAIRIIDRLNRTAVGPNLTSEMEPFEHQVSLLVKFKSGVARGNMPLEIRLHKPSGESITAGARTVLFEGEEDRGADIIIHANVKFDMTGIYWFELLLNETRMTRVPLRIVYLTQITQNPTRAEGQ